MGLWVVWFGMMVMTRREKVLSLGSVLCTATCKHREMSHTKSKLLANVRIALPPSRTRLISAPVSGFVAQAACFQLAISSQLRRTRSKIFAYVLIYASRLVCLSHNTSEPAKEYHSVVASTSSSRFHKCKGSSKQ